MNCFLRKSAIWLMVLMMWSTAVIAKEYKYRTVPNDPMKVRMYTLDNGLQVYLSQVKNEPRVAAQILVRCGGKTDPASNTGLAHYFEHLMFKGTQKLGTMDYTTEKVYLDKIEDLYEKYSASKDEAVRKSIYHSIDSISQIAARYAVPNEYDKAMAIIGSKGTNAYTSNDVTVYVEDVPCNRLDNWAMIQADRFSNAVIRLFHTELETVYEEKNMSLVNDTRKSVEQLFLSLYPDHPYGTQTVLGTQENLKNPSIKAIKAYFEKYYVPNNMAIILSGDLDFDKTIQTIDHYFSALKPKGSFEPITLSKFQLDKTVEKDVYGQNNEIVYLAFKTPAAVNRDAELMQMTSAVLYNGNAGMIDLNIMQQQKMVVAFSSAYQMADGGMLILGGQPSAGESLEQAKDRLLEQVEKLKKGEFDEWLLQAVIAQYKLGKMRSMETHAGQASLITGTLRDGLSWESEVKALDRISKFTKTDIVAFAKQYLNTYAVVYKRKGEDKNVVKIAKPTITPLKINRTDQSAFYKNLVKQAVSEITPVFNDFAKEISMSSYRKGVDVWYKQNTLNQLFEIRYSIPIGTDYDRRLALAKDYFEYLNTPKYTAAQIKQEFYKLACSMNIDVNSDYSEIALTGLSENMSKAVALMEYVLGNVQVNEPAYAQLIKDMKVHYANAKTQQRSIFGQLQSYVMWGKDVAHKDLITPEQMEQIKPNDLVDLLKSMHSFTHKIMYYGPMNQRQFQTIIKKEHQLPEKLLAAPAVTKDELLPVEQNKVYLVNYKSNQINFGMYAKAHLFSQEIYPITAAYNAYFGGTMSGIVFQEMREARGLAYTATARLTLADMPWNQYAYTTFIATQNDKLKDATMAFLEIINEMPLSEGTFESAKKLTLDNIRTSRITRGNVLWTYDRILRQGNTDNPDKILYAKFPEFSLQSVKAFQEKYVKGKHYIYFIVGDKTNLDLNYLNSIAPVQELSLEEVFGY